MQLGDRMKTYEASVGPSLVKRCPAILRVDGRAFHTFTKGFDKPCDTHMQQCMHAVALALCEDISTARFAYGQSDEVSVLLVDYNRLDSDQWFDGTVQKMVSVAAAIATIAFNREMHWLYAEALAAWTDKITDNRLTAADTEPYLEKTEFLEGKLNRAVFDARVFSIPREDAANNFVWRQQDAVRNSIQSAGQQRFSHNELHGKSCDDIQEMLFSQYGINWNDFPVEQKRGFAVYRKPGTKKTPSGSVEAMMWAVDTEIPTFTKDRDFVDALVHRTEE